MFLLANNHRIKYLAINGHGRHKVFDDYFQNGGLCNGVQIPAGDIRFSNVPVLLLDDKVTEEQRTAIALQKFNAEEEGSKILTNYDYMQLFGVRFKDVSAVELEAKYNHICPERYKKNRISEYKGAWNTFAAIPGK